MRYNMKELISTDQRFKKFEDRYYLSVKYHATTHRLKCSLEYLEASQEKLKIGDIFIYKTCFEMAIITYAACFNGSNALLKVSHIPIDIILKDNKELEILHDKVKDYRDKVLAHQDKTSKLDYSIDIVQKDNTIELEFPYLLKLDFNNNEQKNFRNLIIIVHNYLDLKRVQHDEKLKKDICNILLSNTILDDE